MQHHVQLSDSIISNSQTLVNSAIQYIYQNIKNNISVYDISEYLQVSRQYVHRIFKKQTGMTVNTFISHKKIEYAMEKAVVRVVRQLKQPEKKKAVVEEIKKEVKPSIREKLALNVAKIQREEAERKQLNKGRSHSSDLEL